MISCFGRVEATGAILIVSIILLFMKPAIGYLALVGSGQPGSAELIDKTKGQTELCRNNDPDGTVVLNNGSGSEILLLFKANKFWVIGVETLREKIDDDRKVPLFGSHNRLNVGDHFTELQSLTGPRYYTSFYGRFNTSGQFKNNVFVLNQGSLYRYVIQNISESFRDDQPPKIETKFISETSTQFWVAHFNTRFDIDMVKYIYSIPESHMLVIALVLPDQSNLSKTVYTLSETQLENPYALQAGDPDPTDKRLISKHIVPHDETAVFLRFYHGGSICMGIKSDNWRCRKSKELYACGHSDTIQEQSFAIWLSQKFNLSFSSLALILIILNSIYIIALVGYLGKCMIDLVGGLRESTARSS